MKKNYTLDGVVGNAYAIMGYVFNAMKREHKTKEEIESYTKDAISSNYYHLVAVSVEMCEKLNNE